MIDPLPNTALKLWENPVEAAQDSSQGMLIDTLAQTLHPFLIRSQVEWRTYA